MVDVKIDFDGSVPIITFGPEVSKWQGRDGFDEVVNETIHYFLFEPINTTLTNNLKDMLCRRLILWRHKFIE
jgi:hypothetical protein